MFLFALLLTLYPYARASKNMYGRWHCENNMYFFWCDSWDECQKIMKSAGGERGFYRTPASTRPGPLKYWREHDLKEIFGRMTEGFARLYREHVRWGYGYARFVFAYGVCLALMAYAARDKAAGWLRADGNKWLALYCLAFFGGYPLLCAWYTYIDCSKRFALIMLYPAVYLCVRALKAAREARLGWRLFGCSLKPDAVSAIILLVLLEYIVFSYVYRVPVMDGTY